ncbi:MAG: helix-turn-helix domain-containing protein [Treponema sp.]|nr:helix-turn-helix domain-containing protein [Treponema sp.]
MSRNGRKVRIFSALEAANICGVVNQTAINWIKNGHLKAFTTPGGQYRIYAKDLAAFLEKRGLDASEEALQVIMENANWNTLLIAGGDAKLSEVLRERLQREFSDIDIIQAFDGFETGRSLAEKRPGFILLDTEFPGVDCPRLVATIRADSSFGRPFILLIGGFASGEDPGNDVAAVFPKPPDLDRITSVIRDLEGRIESADSA